jgi:drug/metabolite transporter (DMT)-like permease
MHLKTNQVDLGLIFVVLIWGSAPTFMKHAIAELGPLTFVFLRFVLLCILSSGILYLRGRRGGRAWRIRRKDVPLIILSGCTGYGFYQLCFIVGLSRTTVFASALLVSTVPLWSTVLLAVLRVERVSAVQWAGVCVGLVAVAAFLMLRAPPSNAVAQKQGANLGNALTLGAAGLFAVYGIVNKRLARSYSPPELMCYTLLVGTIVLIPFTTPALLSQAWAKIGWQSWALVPYSVLFPIYLTYSVWNWAIGVRGVGYVTIYSYAVPVVGGLCGFALVGEAVSGAQLLAGAAIIGAMLLGRWGNLRANAAERAQQPSLAVTRGAGRTPR